MKRFAIILAATTALAAPAFAADIITEEPPAPAPVEIAPAYNWTGLYIGGQAGVAFGGGSGAIGPELGLSGLTTFQDSPDVGFTGGGHVGYDYQLDSGLILGGVADFNYIDHNRSVGFGTDDADLYSADVDVNYFGTVRGKVGYAMDRVAVYATGGLAYGDVDIDVNNDEALAALGAGFGASTDTDKDNIGYTVGGGVDFLATQNLSFGLEYLYTDLGSAKSSTTFTTAGADAFTVDTKTDVDFHTVMAKASYRFN